MADGQCGRHVYVISGIARAETKVAIVHVKMGKSAIVPSQFVRNMGSARDEESVARTHWAEIVGHTDQTDDVPTIIHRHRH